MPELLSPYSFATAPEILRSLGPLAATDADLKDRAVIAANKALGRMERHCARRLAWRTYRTPVSVAFTWTTGTTLAGATATVRAGDAALGAGLSPGSVVASITDSGHLELDRPVASGSGGTVSFGSAPLRADGNQTGRCYVPERPVSDLYSASWVDAAGNSTALNTANFRLTDQGLLILPSDTFPRGEANIVLECAAGYRRPSATIAGHYSEWSDLRGIQLRLAAVTYKDDTEQPGRTTSKTIGLAGGNMPGWEMPKDIAEDLEPYRRRMGW